MNDARISAFLSFLLALLLLLTACASTTVTDDLPVDTLLAAAQEELEENGSYLVLDVTYLADDLTPPDYLLESAILRADVGNNLDEVGVFHVTSGNAGNMKQLLTDYLARSYEQNREWYDSYIPHQTSKLRDARVFTLGNYVFYTILDEDDREDVVDAIRDVFSQDRD